MILPKAASSHNIYIHNIYLLIMVAPIDCVKQSKVDLFYRRTTGLQVSFFLQAVRLQH